MMFALDVKNRIPSDGCRKLFSKMYLDHIAVNQLSFWNYRFRNFKQLLRLVNADNPKAALNNVLGYWIARSTT